MDLKHRHLIRIEAVFGLFVLIAFVREKKKAISVTGTQYSMWLESEWCCAMLKLLFLVIFLSVEAQRLKINSNRERAEITLSAVNNPINNAIGTYRLPNATRPESYLINLNFDDFHDGKLDFTGNVFITIRVVEDTNTITLHNSLTVIGTELMNSGAQIPHTVSRDDERDFMIIITMITLTKGSIVQLTVRYGGTIGTSIAGIYRGSYLHNDNERRCRDPSLRFRRINSSIFRSTDISSQRTCNRRSSGAYPPVMMSHTSKPAFPWCCTTIKTSNPSRICRNSRRSSSELIVFFSPIHFVDKFTITFQRWRSKDNDFQSDTTYADVSRGVCHFGFWCELNDQRKQYSVSGVRTTRADFKHRARIGSRRKSPRAVWESVWNQIWVGKVGSSRITRFQSRWNGKLWHRILSRGLFAVWAFGECE